MVTNVFVMGKLPAQMESIIGKTTGDIADFHPPALKFFLAGFRMFSVLLLTYSLGLAMLVGAFKRGNQDAGTVIFVMQGAYLSLALVVIPMTSFRTPWYVFAVSAVLTLAAFDLARKR